MLKSTIAIKAQEAIKERVIIVLESDSNFETNSFNCSIEHQPLACLNYIWELAVEKNKTIKFSWWPDRLEKNESIPLIFLKSKELYENHVLKESWFLNKTYKEVSEFFSSYHGEVFISPNNSMRKSGLHAIMRVQFIPEFTE